MLKSGDERRAHLKLDESCIEIGGHSSEYRGLLCFALKTTMPRSMKIHLCHACHNGNCANTNHLYWGTPSENRIDAEIAVPKRSGKSNWAIFAEKNPEAAKAHFKKLSAAGVQARKKKRLLGERSREVSA